MTKFPTTLREDGKVQKGPNYEAPDLARVLANQVLGIITGKRAPWDDVTTASRPGWNTSPGVATTTRPVTSLDAALRELFSGADEHVVEAHQQSITDFLRDAGFQPELGVSG